MGGAETAPRKTAGEGIRQIVGRDAEIENYRRGAIFCARGLDEASPYIV